MKLLRTGLTAVALAASLCGGAGAAPLFAAGGNQFIYNNYETPYRRTAECGTSNPNTGGTYACLDFVSGQDPAGWQQVDGSVPGNLKSGDVFVGLVSGSKNNKGITGSGGTIWSAGTTSDIFSGYFAQEVGNIYFSPTLVNTKVQLVTAAVDPFGVLNTAAGEMFRFYANLTTGLTATGSILTNISEAIGNGGGPITFGGNAANLWAAVGFGANSAVGSQGYAYTTSDFNLGSGSGNLDESIALAALNVLTRGATYSAGELNKLNDSVDNDVGGTIANTTQLLCSAADIAASATFSPGVPGTGAGRVGVACTDFIVKTRIDPNSIFVAGDNTGTDNSSWQYTSFDPLQLNRIPEPGSLALMGLALAGLGIVRRRRAA